MLTEAFDLGEQLKLKEVYYKLHQPVWHKHDFSGIDLSLSKWTTIKYLNDDGNDFHQEINQLPNDRGGIYMFSIKCPIIPGMTDFPAYIGRAKMTEYQNLRKRCREYFTKWYRNDERPLITKLIKYWGSDLYLSFIELGENDEIQEYEDKLVRSLLLPFNADRHDVKINQAIQAFP